MTPRIGNYLETRRTSRGDDQPLYCKAAIAAHMLTAGLWPRTEKKLYRARMIKRATTRTVTFAHPFTLSGIDEVQPAGNYTVESDEGLIQTLSFPAYRSIGTWIRLPSQGRDAILMQAVSVMPSELDAVLAKDALGTRPIAERPVVSVSVKPVLGTTSRGQAIKAGIRHLLISLARLHR